MTTVQFPVPVWYKVRNHRAFSRNYAYRCLGYVAYGETAWSYLILIDIEGRTWQVRVDRCTALSPAAAPEFFDQLPNEFVRLLTEREGRIPWASKPDWANPDLDTDL